MTEPDEPVGSLGEEAAKLVAALLTGRPDADATMPESMADLGGSTDHGCPHGWCPLCRVADYLIDHPEIVAQVVEAGAHLFTVVREAVDNAAAHRPSDADGEGPA
ncbi:MAG: hypothetical protein QM621_07680 [Aeromicrobium sp.]|uniref:hypothetical protein n=1 Tax=Aeromicrobium sp. TaxID=1871063 RepID=UPI0039E3746B